MSWYLGGVRIYVEKDSGWIPKPRIGEINVLDSNQTILHYAGRESHIRQLQFVVFSGYSTQILPMVDGDSYELISDHGSQGNVIIKTMKADRLQALNYPEEVCRVTVELIKDGE